MAIRQLEYVISSGAYVVTNYVPNINTECEIVYCKFPRQSNGSAHSGLVGGQHQRFRFASTQTHFYWQHGSDFQNYSSVNEIEGSVKWNNTAVTINDIVVLTKGAGSRSSSVAVAFFCNGDYLGSDVVTQPTRLGEVIFRENGNVVADYIPIIDDNDVVCFYETIGSTYHYATSGSLTAGPMTHIFYSSKSKLSFQSIQSSQNITITAETGWTATTNNNWISLSQNTGSTGDTNVTVTVADGSNDGSRVGKITFTDAEDYTFDVDVYQLKLGMKVYLNRYKVGSTNIVKQQRGEDNVKKMYMGNDLVYQKFSFAPTLSINVDSMEFKFSGDTAQSVTVNSNTNWNYTTDANWLTLTKDGNTLSVLPSDYTSELENRTATITITADNGDIVKTKTISVTQKKVMAWEALDYVYTNGPAYINTNIVPTTSTKFRTKFKVVSTNGGLIVGYMHNSCPITCENDQTDYRFFNHRGLNDFSFDFNANRTYGYGTTDENGMYDITCGNNYIYDNVAGATAGTGTTQSQIATQRNVPMFIYLDGSYGQVQQVTIYGDNDVVVFDGYAADVDGDYGIYDTVSETLLKPTNGATVYKGTCS